MSLSLHQGLKGLRECFLMTAQTVCPRSPRHTVHLTHCLSCHSKCSAVINILEMLTVSETERKQHTYTHTPTHLRFFHPLNTSDGSVKGG